MPAPSKAVQDRGALQRLVCTLDKLALITGKLCAGLIPVMVLLTFIVVVLRKGFNTGSIGLQEAVVYVHAFVFLMAMAYTFKADGQVRVDIFYRNASPRFKAWVNAVCGVVLLLPLCVVLLYTSTDFALRSWVIGEVSGEAGGLPLVYLLKSLLPLASALLLLQCLADVLANTLILIDRAVTRAE